MNDPCKRIRPLLYTLFEDGTSQGEAALITAHLAQCRSCRDEFEEERVLTRRLRSRRRFARSWHRPVAAATAAVAAAAAMLLWITQDDSHGTIVTTPRELASAVDEPTVEPLGELNHVALPAGTRTSIDVTDCARVEAEGPAAFEIDRTTAGWKLTLLDGTLDVHVNDGVELMFVAAHETTRLTGGIWHVTTESALRVPQDPVAELLAKARRTFQVAGDMSAAERQFRSVIDHERCSATQRRVASYFLFCTQQRLGRHTDAIATIDRWLRENPDDSEVPRTLVQKGVNYAMNGQRDAAGKVWQDVVDRFPQHEAADSARRMMGRAAGAGPQRPATTEIERLARECASETAWELDVTAAMERAQREQKPLLVYVRCTHASRAFLAARDSLAAPAIPLSDSGYAKDLLFRAGALADERVAATIAEDFVPLLVTYDFHSHGKGLRDAVWSGFGRGDHPQFDARVGASGPGSLVAHGARCFVQGLVRPEHRTGDEFRFRGRIRTRGSKARFRLYWSERGSDQVHGTTEQVADDSEWTAVDYTFTPETPLINVLVMPTATGRGTSWFDDCELLLFRDGEQIGGNLLVNGECHPDFGGNDPLLAFGTRATDVVTPALLVVESGKVSNQLHRIGAVSAQHVARWLAGAAGRAPREPRLADAHTALGAARWADAVELLTLSSEADGEAAFLLGLALHRTGRRHEAGKVWRRIAGPTRHGRRAAACLLPAGPFPPQAISLRDWPATSSPSSSEVDSADGFVPAQSIDILLEMQQENGGFVDHLARARGSELRTHWDTAYAALAGDALLQWRERAAAAQQQRMNEALAGIGRFLAARSREPARSYDAFNDPYAVDFLLSVGEREAAARFVGRIQSRQQKDGSWTVYGPVRPTSFNTAQNAIALWCAQKAGLTVDGDALERGLATLAGMRRTDGRFSYAPLPGFKWLTTPVGGVAREALCEHALSLAGLNTPEQLAAALDAFVEHHAVLRAPTKHYSGDFNKTGHGSYFFYYAHRNAIDAAEHTDPERRARVQATVREAVLSSREADGSFEDHALYGRVYGTAMALSILGRIR